MLKLHLADLQVTSFETNPAAGAAGTVVGHDGKAPTGAEVTCQFWTCNGCQTGGCDTEYLSCGVSCQSCVESCGALDTCDAMATCLAYPSCADTCWQTCFRCPVP
ncbi:MAG TPA: hypothetical protein VFR37_00955 [Longimicrobium sp.]|nr:hypothetical protein [Longimicrobium sp.]